MFYKLKSIFIFLLACSFLKLNSKEIEYYFKKVEKKPDIHKFETIDFIYVINLDERPEKFQDTLNELKPYGIIPYRFSAVNGWKLPNQTISDLGVKYAPGMLSGYMATSYLIENKGQATHEIVQNIGQNYLCHCMTRGAIGIVLSHLSVLQDAFDSGYETIWVMEDDIAVKKNPLLLTEMIKKLDALVGKNGWDILFTDQDTKNDKDEYVPCNSYAWRPNFIPTNNLALKQDISPDFRRTACRYGAYSMIVRRSGMKKILDFFKRYNMYLPYDMDFTLPDNILMFNVRNDIISTKPNAITDNGRPYYENKGK